MNIPKYGNQANQCRYGYDDIGQLRLLKPWQSAPDKAVVFSILNELHNHDL